MLPSSGGATVLGDNAVVVNDIPVVVETEQVEVI